MAGKGGILALLASPKKGGSKGPPVGDMGGEPEAGGDEVGSALREMFDALKAGDDAGAAIAFKRAKAACEEEYEEPEEEAPLSGEGEDDLDL